MLVWPGHHARDGSTSLNWLGGVSRLVCWVGWKPVTRRAPTPGGLTLREEDLC